MAGWTQLPTGQDVTIAGNFFYAAIASVKSTHSAQDIKNLISGKGLQIIDYQDPAPLKQPNPDGADYRFVAVEAFAPKDVGVLPWSLPWPLSMTDSSHLVEVWAAPKDQGQPSTPPAAKTTSSASMVPWLAVGAVAAAIGIAAGGWWLLHRRRERLLLA